MTLTREEYDADGECVRRIAEKFVVAHPEQEVQDAVGRRATTDVEFEDWLCGVLAPYARQVMDRCEGDVSRLYGAGYFVGFEQWSAASAIVKAALYMTHGRDSMLAFMSGSVVIDSRHPAGTLANNIVVPETRHRRI